MQEGGREVDEQRDLRYEPFVLCYELVASQGELPWVVLELVRVLVQVE